MPIVSVLSLWIFEGVRSIAGFTPIAFRHPHGLYTLAIRDPDQVANRAVARNEALQDFWPADLDLSLRERRTETLWQRGNMFNGGNSLPVQGFGELFAPERGLLVFHSQARKLLNIKA